MKNGTNADSLPPLISGIVNDSKHYIDNLFADTWKKLEMNSLIKGAGFTKRSGIEVTEAVFIDSKKNHVLRAWSEFNGFAS